ncbi:MAG: EamA family transporter [Candidatus Aenigmarchaeota archaeon]|nr:EamA family transporter [Candidatus Aenigmarchaeota archaeon]
MLWLVFALTAALADGIKSVIHRAVMKTESVFSYALIENLLTALAFIPFLYFDFLVPTDPAAWALLMLSSALWVAVALTGFAAYKHTPVTLKEPISQSRIILVFLLSVALLKEAMSTEKIIGTLLIFAGLIAITTHKRKIFGKLSDRGVQLTILSAFLASVVAIIDKIALGYFTPGTYGFFVYLIPGLILATASRGRTNETKKLIKSKGKYVLAAILLGATAYYSILKAYTLADASTVFPIIRLGSFVAVIGGFAAFREERTEVLKKVVSAAVIVIGVLLLSGHHSFF